ncbi:MAG: hypothetical protein ACOYO1_11150 [Bacteroidales bacterium]
MLTIKINDTSLTIDPKTKLRFDINSPIFETDAIPGSYICPFDLSVTGNDIFENAEFIEVNRIYKKYNCVVYLSDYPLFSGELVLNTSNPKRYRCSVILTGIASDFPDKKLNELEYGNDIPFTSILEYAFTQNTDVTDAAVCVFPVIHAPNMYGSSDDDTESPANPDYGGEIYDGAGKVGKFLNNWDWRTFWHLQYNFIQPAANTMVDNAFVLVPQFKLIYLVKKIFESLGYIVSGDFFSDPFISKLLFLNYFAADKKVKKYFVAAKGLSAKTIHIYLQKLTFEDDYSLGNEDLDNCFLNSHYTIMKEGYVNVKLIMNVKNSIVNSTDLFSISVIVGNVAHEFRYYHAVNTYTEITFNASVFVSTVNIGQLISIAAMKDQFQDFDLTYSNAKLEITHVSFQELNRFSSEIHIANHVTSNTIGTVLNALKTNFGLAMWFDGEGKATEVSFLKDVLKSHNSIDITDFVVKDSLEITTQESIGYKLTQKNDDEAKDVAILTNLGKFMKKSDLPTPDKLNIIAEVLQEGCFYQYKKNENDQTLSWVKYGTSVGMVTSVTERIRSAEVAMEIGITTNVILQDRLVPDSKQEGTSEFFDTGVNETDMQLLIWHGMKPDKNGHNYPFASALRYSIDGTPLSDIELRLDGAHGLFANFLQPWYDFLDTAEQICLQMKIGDEKLIELLKLFKPQANKASQQIRKIKYQGSLLLPKTMSFIIPVSGGFIETEITALKEGGIEL